MTLYQVKQAYRYLDPTTFSFTTGVSEPWLLTLSVVKETQKTYTVQDPYEPAKLRRCLRTAKKRYAYFTKQDALNAYIKRKQCQLRHLKHEVEMVTRFVADSCSIYDSLYGPPKRLTYKKPV